MIQAVRASESINFATLARRQVYSLGGFSVFALGMMLAKYSGWPNKAVALQDRTYRIHYNEGQVRVDTVTQIFFAGSLFLSLLITRNPAMSLGMTSPAIVAGILYHVATKPKKGQI